MSVGSQPEVFGKIIDNLMVSSGDLRNIAYDIIVRLTETPDDFPSAIFLRMALDIDPSDDREVNIKKLCEEFGHCDVEQLEEKFAEEGFSIDDVIANKSESLITVADVVTKHIIDYWRNHLNSQTKGIEELLPHAEEVVFMLINLFDKLAVKKSISDKIHSYSKIFNNDGLPNAIANYVSLTLNDFVSNIGREYIADSELENIQSKADACNIKVNLSPQENAVTRKPRKLEDTLKAFDDSADVDTVTAETLLKLPLWGSFKRWENLVKIGLLYASDISNANPEANAALKELMNQCEALYN